MAVAVPESTTRPLVVNDAVVVVLLVLLDVTYPALYKAAVPVGIVAVLLSMTIPAVVNVAVDAPYTSP